MATTITIEPIVITAGDTVKWEKSLADYPASSWTLKYYIKGNGISETVTASANGDDHSVTIAKATTAAWSDGAAWMDGYVDNGSERYKVYSGNLSVKADLSAASSSYDGRSHAKRVIDAIEAVLEGRASKDQEEMTLAGKTLKRTPIDELLVLRDSYKAEYEIELADEKNEVTVMSLLPADSRSASENGTGVDISGYEGTIRFTLDCEAGSGTSPTNDVKLQDSPDNSVWTDVAGATFTQATDSSASFETMGVHTTALGKYVRAVSTLGGTSPVFVFAVLAVGKKKYL